MALNTKRNIPAKVLYPGQLWNTLVLKTTFLFLYSEKPKPLHYGYFYFFL